jgi:hypothetical protein
LTVRSLRFHHEIYSAQALEATVEVFGEVADIESTQKMPYFEVALTAKDDADEDEVAGEFGNYALALTIEEKRGGQ